MLSSDSTSTMSEKAQRNSDMEIKDFALSYMKKNLKEKFECEYNNIFLNMKENKNRIISIPIDSTPLKIIPFISFESINVMYFKISYYFYVNNIQPKRIASTISKYSIYVRTEQQHVNIQINVTDLLRYVFQWESYCYLL
jgi:hypothetical protein